MAEAYVKEETGRFKFAKLLDYKSLAMANKTYSINCGKFIKNDPRLKLLKI